MQELGGEKRRPIDLLGLAQQFVDSGVASVINLAQPTQVIEAHEVKETLARGHPQGARHLFKELGGCIADADDAGPGLHGHGLGDDTNRIAEVDQVSVGSHLLDQARVLDQGRHSAQALGKTGRANRFLPQDAVL